jgi:type II secretory pathway pseudopilin PulG
MVVITIIAIMASIAIFGLPSVSQKGQDTQKLAVIREVELALAAYKNINGKYPDNLPTLVPGYIKTAPSTSDGYNYILSTDKKSFCFGAIGTIYKSSAQKDLESDVCEKSWITCNGMESDTLVSGFGTMCGGGGIEASDPSLDIY